MTSTPTNPPDATPPRLKRAEFVALLTNEKRRERLIDLLVGAGLLLVLSSLPAFAECLRGLDIERDSPWRLLQFAPMFAWLFGSIALARFLMPAELAKCFACHQPISNRRVAVVSGRCPKCAASLFVDDGPRHTELPASDATRLLSQADIVSASRQRPPRSYRRSLGWFVSGAILLAGGLALWPTIRAQLTPLLGEVWTPLIHPLLLAPGVSVAYWSIAIFARSNSPRVIPCPHCGDAITRHAIQTGNCSTCGQPAVGDPFPGLAPRDSPNSSSGIGWTIEVFRRIARVRERQVGLGTAVWVAVGFVAFVLMGILAKRFGEEPLRAVHMIFSVGGIFGLPITLSWWWRRRMSRDLRCPACDGELLSGHRLVVSSRRCYHCGSVILRDSWRAS